MRRSNTRVMFAGLLVVSFAWAVSLGGQPPIVVGGAQPKKDKKDEKGKFERPTDDENIPFGFPYDRDTKKQLEAARDYLAFKEIPWNTVCTLLQTILEAKSDSFFNIPDKVGDQVRTRRISVRTEANRIISAFKDEGLQFYQQAYGQEASKDLDTAITANYDLPTLANLSQKYFHTKAGAEATILLGTLYLERGNYLEAAYAFERVFARPQSEDLITPRTLFKACIAFKRSGDPKHTEMLKVTLEKLRTATEKDGLLIGRSTYGYDKLKAEIDRPIELLRATTTVGEWSMRGGNPARSGTIDGGPPFLDPIFRSTMFYNTKPEEEDAHTWIRTELDRLFARDRRAPGGLPLPAFFPITTADMVIFRTFNGVYGVATRDQVVDGRVIRAGDIRWISKTTFGVHQMLTPGETDDVEMRKNVQDWWGTYNQAGVSSILHENPLLGSLAHDGQYAYFVDDISIPPPPQMNDPNFGGMVVQQYRQQGELADAVRAGRLVAVDMKSGNMKWDLGRVRKYPVIDPNADRPPPLPPLLNEEEGDKTTSAFQLCLDAVFLGPPLPLNGKLYVLIEQAGLVRLLCLDPKNLVAVPGQTRKPAIVWSQKLGRPNNTLPQDSVRRFQGCTLTASEGILICPTNSGAIVAVDIMSRSLLWAHAYRRLDPNAVTKPMWNPQTGQPIMPEQLKQSRWRASGPIIANGRVMVSAYDSDKLECLDLRTGKMLWSVPRDSNDLYVGGVINDRVVVVGRNQVKAYHLTNEDQEKREPKVAFEPMTLLNATPTGHGVGGKGVFYVPVRQENAGRDGVPAAEIWAVNVETGQVLSKTGARKNNDAGQLAKYGLGNLVFQDGMVFAQSAWELACYPQLEQKRNEMDRLLKVNPKDPLGLLTRGELSLDAGELQKAIADFKDAEKNNLPKEKQPLLREKLYMAYTELLRNDFAAGESILPEYATLCKLSIDPDLDPAAKQHLLDESERRQRLHLYLLANGREAQGRLGEAFDNYLALANLGEGKSLLDIPDEPNVRMRPDVWARGRIESMIRKAMNPAARKSLEDRVNTEWETVKTGTNLKRLREFVSVFGPYFQSGAEAQFLLSEKLLLTNNEIDTREAQTHLSQLRVSAEEPTVRARATEALARLMVQNLLMEDAVGLYLQLGREYATVVVRDGKTGADYLTQLLTDKRLFPYLEPSRYPMPTRMKAELRTDAVQNPNVGAQFEIEPGGDLLPMFKRYRFVIDQYVSGNGTWTLRAFDRATGAEKAAFRNMAPPQFNNPGNMPFSKFVKANGQLVLVQLGTMVYCLDLAEKKERWQKNLLGDPGPGVQPQQVITEPGTDGEVTVKYADGYYLTLGKATVLQPGYCALLTRDGIEVVEPFDRRVLWTRKNLPERVRLFGDARHLVIVETDDRGKPVSVKLLRAVDGMPVDGSPDSGRALATAKWFNILGRTVLLAEGTGDQPQVLRLLDLATGKDIWKREYDPKAVPIKSQNADWTGFVKSNGEAEVIDVKTGKVFATLKIDEKNLEADLKPCNEAQLFTDADRFYLVLDRDPSLPSTNGTRRQPLYGGVIRTQKVNGPLYAFDRASGKRLWHYGNGVFENQLLILEQFAELPVIMAVSPIMASNNQLSYQVVVLEKARGKLVFDRPVNFNGGFFQNMNVNLKNGTIELNRYDLRVLVSPDDGPRPAGP